MESAGYAEAQMEYAAGRATAIASCDMRKSQRAGKQDGLYLGMANPIVWSHELSPRPQPPIRLPGQQASRTTAITYGAESQGRRRRRRFRLCGEGKMIGGFALVAWPASMACPESGPFLSITMGGLRKDLDRRRPPSPPDDTVQSGTSWRPVVLE